MNGRITCRVCRVDSAVAEGGGDVVESKPALRCCLDQIVEEDCGRTTNAALIPVDAPCGSARHRAERCLAHAEVRTDRHDEAGHIVWEGVNVGHLLRNDPQRPSMRCWATLILSGWVGHTGHEGVEARRLARAPSSRAEMRLRSRFGARTRGGDAGRPSGSRSSGKP